MLAVQGEAESNRLILIYGEYGWSSSNNKPMIELNTWQLIHFNLTSTPGRDSLDISVFADGVWVTSKPTDLTDLSGLTLRVGDAAHSFIGDVSAVQMLSPSGRSLSFSKKTFFLQ